MDDLDDWFLGELLGGFFQFCRRFWHVLLITAIIAALLIAIVVGENQSKAECRAKGGIPVDTTDRGLRCMKGHEIR
jgi:hypothetical protein